jgi:hypothetical protein
MFLSWHYGGFAMVGDSGESTFRFHPAQSSEERLTSVIAGLLQIWLDQLAG